MKNEDDEAVPLVASDRQGGDQSGGAVAEFMVGAHGKKPSSPVLGEEKRRKGRGVCEGKERGVSQR
jgi:hypothetical protein